MSNPTKRPLHSHIGAPTPHYHLATKKGWAAWYDSEGIPPGDAAHYHPPKHLYPGWVTTTFLARQEHWFGKIGELR